MFRQESNSILVGEPRALCFGIPSASIVLWVTKNDAQRVQRKHYKNIFRVSWIFPTVPYQQFPALIPIFLRKSIAFKVQNKSRPEQPL
jgi:hypothetical protein